MPNELPEEMCDVIMDEWFDLELEAQELEALIGEKMSEQLDQTTDEDVAWYQDQLDEMNDELEAINAAKQEKVNEMTEGHCYGLDEDPE